MTGETGERETGGTVAVVVMPLTLDSQVELQMEAPPEAL